MKCLAIYYRVSTDKQDFDSQKAGISQWLAQQPEQYKTIIIEDKAISGSKNHHSDQFKRLMHLADTKQIDGILVYSLDRFSREANITVQKILSLDAQNVAFISVTDPLLNLGLNFPLRRTIVGILADIAELEKKKFISRIRSGLAARKQAGKKLGPAYKIDRTKVRELRQQGKTVRQIAAHMDISIGSVSEILAS